MTTVSRTFTVDPAPHVVVEYLSDFGNAEQWDPGTESCTRNDAGPIAVGANWHNKSRIAGLPAELTYTLTELAEHRIVLVGENDSATSTETIDAVPDGSGTRITYTNDLEMHGAAKLATPALKLIFEKLGNDTEKKLTEVLNSLAGN